MGKNAKKWLEETKILKIFKNFQKKIKKSQKINFQEKISDRIFNNLKNLLL